MATVRVKFRASSVDMREGTLYYQIIHNRVARQINAGYKVYEFEWDANKGQARLEEAIDQSRRDYLVSLNENITTGLRKLAGIVADMEQSHKAYTSDIIVSEYAKAVRGGGFITFMRKQKERLGKRHIVWQRA